MQRQPSVKTEKIGLARVRLAVLADLGWVFRDQPEEDYGIDAHVEIDEDSNVVPKLLALQVKAGLSWFSEPGPGGWWYRPDAAHVKYWTNHSLPVVVILCHPETELCHWQLINNSHLERTSGGGWKILVPEAKRLDESARAPLREAAEGDPYVLRIRDLQLARPWMELLADGKRLVVDIEEWVNKTSGRGSILLGVDNEDGEDPTPLATWGVFLGLSSYAEVVPRLFAWADVSVHEETYDDADHDLYESECVIFDSEGDRFVTEDYDQWVAGRGLTGLRPYSNGTGEVADWRLELMLNDLGKSFLIVDQFATQGDRQLTPRPGVAPR